MSLKSIFSKKFIVGTLLATLVAGISFGSATYAFWRVQEVNEGNVITTGELAVDVSLQEGETEQTPLLIENLYPSLIHFEQRTIFVSNEGTIGLHFQINFLPQVEGLTGDELEIALELFDNILVSVNEGEWLPFSEVTYTFESEEFGLTPEDTHEISLRFRLSEEVTNPALMNQELAFVIETVAIQWEDTFTGPATPTV